MSIPERHMSRSITLHHADGRTEYFRNAIAHVSRNEKGEIATVAVTPFTREIPFTLYHDAPLAFHLPEQ